MGIQEAIIPPALLAMAEEPVRYSMRQIASAVAEANGLQVADLLGPERVPHIAWPRQRAFMLCRQQGKSLTQIARFFGRHHTTIIKGIRRAESRAAAN